MPGLNPFASAFDPSAASSGAPLAGAWKNGNGPVSPSHGFDVAEAFPTLGAGSVLASQPAGYWGKAKPTPSAASLAAPAKPAASASAGTQAVSVSQSQPKPPARAPLHCTEGPMAPGRPPHPPAVPQHKRLNGAAPADARAAGAHVRPPPAPVSVQALMPPTAPSIPGRKSTSPTEPKVRATGFNLAFAKGANAVDATADTVTACSPMPSPFSVASAASAPPAGVFPPSASKAKIVSPLSKALSAHDLQGLPATQAAWGTKTPAGSGAALAGAPAAKHQGRARVAEGVLLEPCSSGSPPSSQPIMIQKHSSRQKLMDMAEVEEMEEELNATDERLKAEQAWYPTVADDVTFEDGFDARSCSSVASRPSLCIMESASKSLGTALTELAVLAEACDIDAASAAPAALAGQAGTAACSVTGGASESADSHSTEPTSEDERGIDTAKAQVAAAQREMNCDGPVTPCSSTNMPLVKVCPSDFKLLKVVGQGAFGKVFQVQFKRDQKVYAMKVMKKETILQKDHGEYVKSERDLLTAVIHPYIVTLRFSFQTPTKLYLVLDFINGGHLFFNLYRQGVFSDDVARLYTAEIVSAISYLHARGIAHRDLKPENVLLDSEGHVKLTDFGLAKSMDSAARTNSFIGTMEYMAPEIVEGKGHGVEVDWWSVGILLYEMLCGMPPFRAKSRQALQQQILSGKIKWPKFLNSDAQNLIKGLLARDASKRLGAGPDGAEAIKKHPFFKTINWAKLERREIESKFKPEVSNSLDVANFDKIWTEQSCMESPCGTPTMPTSLHNFKGFTYVAPSMLERAAC